jgi:hypothetical protein
MALIRGQFTFEVLGGGRVSVSYTQTALDVCTINTDTCVVAPVDCEKLYGYLVRCAVKVVAEGLEQCDGAKLIHEYREQCVADAAGIRYESPYAEPEPEPETVTGVRPVVPLRMVSPSGVRSHIVQRSGTERVTLCGHAINDNWQHFDTLTREIDGPCRRCEPSVSL